MDINRTEWDLSLKVGGPEARPTDRLPIIRRDDSGHMIPELRRWVFAAR